MSRQFCNIRLSSAPSISRQDDSVRLFERKLNHSLPGLEVTLISTLLEPVLHLAVVVHVIDLHLTSSLADPSSKVVDIAQQGPASARDFAVAFGKYRLPLLLWMLNGSRILLLAAGVGWTNWLILLNLLFHRHIDFIA